ncbi:hypothetical protein MRB53_040930 [Persea americana]|nr:hypothetical protein MRB53_040930 [Persea americana]
MGEEAVTTQGKVDPEAIPSVARARDVATQQYQTQVYPTMEKHLPPPAAVPFVGFDQGNSAPKFARLTVNNIPATAEALNTTALPLGLILQPLASLQEGEMPIPVLDFGEAGPPRCRRCRTDYFAPTDPSGARVDRAQRPELMLATCEGIIKALYGPDPEQDTDDSAEPTLPRIPVGAKVGVITYDKDINFYNLSASLTTPPDDGHARSGRPLCALATGRDTDHEKKLFTTEHPGFKKTAAAMVTAGIGVDFFIAAPGWRLYDVATIGHMARLTGGEIFYYPNFMAPRDTLKYTSELEHAVTREIGFQALMKVRCSNGLQVQSYHGGFLQHTFGADLEIGTIDADKALGVVFSYDGKLDTKLDAHFQAALLYTAATGQRRVRCINIVAGVCEGAADTMRTVDQDAVV